MHLVSRHDRGRPGAVGPTTSDLVVAGALAALGAILAFTAAAAQDVAAVLPAVLAAAEAAPLVWRRRAPVGVLVVAAAVFVTGSAITGVAATPMFGPLVAAYTVGTRCRRRVAVTAGLLTAFGLPLLTSGALGVPFPLTVSITATPGHLFDALFGSMVGFGAAILLGAYVGTRRAYVAELAARAEHLEREREERAERAVADERARIARELHDVAAHHLSGIALQASALSRTMDRDPQEARGLVEDIRQESSTALTAMRRLVALLRADDADGRSPQPTLGDVEHLVARARADGVEVDLDVQHRNEPLPREIELAAYRLVQESLTNARQHAPEASATVQIHRNEDELMVEVADNGTDEPAHSDAEAGHGLLGMHERVSLLGGRLEAGPQAGSDGWVVRAVLPIDPGGPR